MRFWKTLLLSIFLGFYFLSITPIHFYAHQIEQDYHDDDYDDCSYVNLLELGQGHFFTPDAIQLELSPEVTFIFEDTFGLPNQLFTKSTTHNFLLRGPPTI